ICYGAIVCNNNDEEFEEEECVEFPIPIDLSDKRVSPIKLWNKSMNSLRVHGLNGFQYPELACSLFIAISVTTHLLEEWKENVLELILTQKYIILYELKIKHRSIMFGSRFPYSMKYFKIWLHFTKVLACLGAIWTIISLGIYASKQNFHANAQLLTNCTAIPTDTSPNTIINCIPQEQGFSFYLWSKKAWIIDIFTRAFLLYTFFVVIPYGNSYSIPVPLNIRGDKPNPNQYYGGLFILGTSFIFMVAIATIQSQGLDVSGLEGVCSVNSELLSSKTGYIREWFQQELTAAKQIAFI
ncbi:26703_t:CDS:2, partial [Racocetra persica]